VVRRLTIKSDIRQRLSADRTWAVYALADLDDDLFRQCRWWGCGGGLALVFDGLAIRPIFVMGTGAEVRALLSELPVSSGYLNLLPEHLAFAAGFYVFRETFQMHRMRLGQFRPRPGDTATLGPADADEVEALYATGDGGGVAFARAQLDTGLFRGVREHGALVAVAGVHVASTSEGVAAVGNVFVRPDRRAGGRAQVALSSTIEAILAQGIMTVALNVQQSNVAAVRAYERLGFERVVSYVEGPAERVHEGV
jgi:GNAT superfamily N-acetyltransferase